MRSARSGSVSIHLMARRLLQHGLFNILARASSRSRGAPRSPRQTLNGKRRLLSEEHEDNRENLSPSDQRESP